MRFYQFLYNLTNRNSCFRQIRSCINNKYFIHSLTFRNNVKYVSPLFHPQSCDKHFETIKNAKDVLEIEDLELFESEALEESKSVRYILFDKSEDVIINKLNGAVSIEDVFKIFIQHEEEYGSEHITQTVLVLHDLQKLYFDVNNLQPNTSNVNSFIETLFKNTQFKRLLKLIDDKLGVFDSTYLSYTLLYLNKLGLNLNDDLIQKIDNFLRFKLENDFNLLEASNYFKTIFVEDNIKPIYQVINIVPKVFEAIDKCESTEDLANVTDCLNKIHFMVNMTVFEKYKKKIQCFLEKEILTSEDTKVFLKVILLLNYPKWRTKNSEFISECILIIQDKIDLLNLDELILLYGVFFKNQEPGEILSTIQRNASKFIHHLDEYGPHQMEKKVKLFSSLIYFSSPLHKVEYRKLMGDYIVICATFPELFHLRKLLCYVKIKDEKLCRKYWDSVLRALRIENGSVYLICQNYLNFNTDIEDFRHYEVENYINKKLNEELRHGNVTMFTSNLVDCLCFFLVYGRYKDVIEDLINVLEPLYTQLSEVECLKLSQYINSANISHYVGEKLKNILNKCTEHLMLYGSNSNASLLLKACVLRNSTEHFVMDDLITELKNTEELSSKIMENVVYSFVTTTILVPEIINKFTYYIVRNKRNILAFNIEKFLFMCYHLGYCPVNGDEFFPVASDIILRDQERLSGLSFLQSALALCFFNKLPNSFIKQIFNVEFMDKLDVELANCYFKDKYPQRVRQHLMELNRAVCLEYPENNVPWFHQKYCDEFHKKANFELPHPKYFTSSVKEYLVQVVGNEEYLLQDIQTPYGYYIDFVLNLNRRKEMVSSNSKDLSSKIALLLVRPHVFTKFYINLKGKYQMKKRHLEMFGYTVSFINTDEWLNLLYAEERLEFLRNKIWLEETNER